jgi:hypothetical protein
MLRLELLRVKADLERELGTWVLDCKACGMDVHWVRASAWRTLAIGDIDDQRRTANRWSSRGTRAAELSALILRYFNLRQDLEVRTPDGDLRAILSPTDLSASPLSHGTRKLFGRRSTDQAADVQEDHYDGI